MIDPEKTYRTRDGREVRIYAVDGAMEYNVHGAIKNDDGWDVASWMNDGRALSAHRFNDSDLIEGKPRIKRGVWVNVYPAFLDSDMVHSTKRMADQEAAPDRIACVKLTIDCEEGEGL